MSSKTTAWIIQLSLLAFSLLVSSAGPLSAQSIFAGEVEGRILDAAGYPIRGAALTLAQAGGEEGLEERTREDGVFSFPYVPGGVYDLWVEALGYRPVLVTGVTVAPGGRVQVPIRLAAEPPPVVRRDTLRWAVTGRGAPTLGRAIQGNQLDAVPDRVRDVPGLMAASSWADQAGGLEGLPAGYTTLFAEGEPFRPAAHPGLPGTGAPYGLLFPRVGLNSATVLTGLEDIEWSGTAGGLVSLETRAPAGRNSGELFGLWSGGPTWTNEVVGDGPAMLSAWGGGSVAFPVAEGASLLALNVEGGLVETPNLFWRNDYYTGDLVPASEPGTRRSGYGAGSGRVDIPFGGDSRVTIRGGFSAFRNESDRLGTPQSGYGVELPGKGIDGSLAAVLARPLSLDFFLEVKGAVNYSSRTWEPEGDAFPGAFLVTDRALVGTNPDYPATSDRLDLSVTPVVHYRSGPNRIKGGFRLEYSSFDMQQVAETGGAFFFGSPRALTAGEGAAIVVPGTPASTGFGVIRTNLFGQYRWTASAGLDVTTGISWKFDRLPMGDITPSEPWAALTDIENVPTETDFHALDGRVHVRWDLAGDGKSWFVGGLGLEHGPFDPAALHEVLTLSGSVPVDRALGAGLDWRDGTVSGDDVVRGERLALFGPNLEAPFTTRAAVGLFRNFDGGIQVGISGALRRTESILRRSDLNRLLEPVGTDQDGRPLYGDLRIVSGVLGPDPATNRRFDDFESVWALDGDGWSEYKGVTASLEAPLGETGSVSVQYTYSQTRDNWVGASRGSALAQLGPDLPVKNWDEAVSDFDVPHRLSALLVLPLPLPWESLVSGLYTFRSDHPFTPRVATGLDANGDGSPFNDIAFVPSAGSDIEALASEWGCVADALGGFPERNSCRGDPVHSVNLRLSLGLPEIGGMSSAIVVDGLNLTDNDMGIRDDNLLVLGGGSVTQNGGTVTVPYKVNPGFGNWVYRGDTGRMLRLGLRIGGGR